MQVSKQLILFHSGFAADGITHSIRPQDVKTRRAAIILRRYLFFPSYLLKTILNL